MSNHSVNKKGVALLMVLMTLLVVVILANIILAIILSQSQLTRHQINRIQAYYAAGAGMNLAFERLRTGTWDPHATEMRYYCINGNVDSGVTCIATITDNNIPYNVQIAVYPTSQPGISNTTRLDIKTDYTYTP